jgi:hypothetical protein
VGLLAEPEFLDPPPGAYRQPHAAVQFEARHREKLRMIESGEIPIVTWDGEGYGSEGHRYVLFGGFAGDGFVELRDEEGIPSLRILDLIWRVARARPNAIHCIYGGSYDFNHWIRWVDEDTARILLHGHPTLIGPFVVRWTGLWFELWRRGERRQPVRVWDVWRFWNTAFQTALRKMFPDDPDLALIESMKARRDSFSWDQIEEMSAYNRAELRALNRMMVQLYRDLDTAGIPFPTFLTGAGSLAGALLGKYGVDRYLGDPRFGNEEIYAAVLSAYAAGRVDGWQIGYHDGPIWLHDLRSAYMWALLECPDLSEGEWRYHEEFTGDWEDRMSVWLVRWNWVGGLDGAPHPCPPTERYFPFFYRKDDTILFPPAGAGWHWWPEVYAARETGWEFQVVGGWVWHPAHPERRPWAWMLQVYERRKYIRDVLGMQGASDMLKHGLAAVYGKHCQARGAVASRPPKFHNLAIAGWVTAYCRAQVNAAAHQKPDAVVYQMTDSVAATERLDLDEGPEVGQWEIQRYERGLFAQAGVGSLWCSGCKDHPGGGEHPKYRGFDSGTIDSEGILRTWRQNALDRYANPYQTWVRRPLNLGSALAQGRFEDWTNWETVPRDLHVYGGGGKRTSRGVFWIDRPWERLVPLEPTAAMYGENGAVRASLANMEDHALAQGLPLPLSEPYEPAWASEDPYALPEKRGTLRDLRLEDDDDLSGEQA